MANFIKHSAISIQSKQESLTTDLILPHSLSVKPADVESQSPMTPLMSNQKLSRPFFVLQDWLGIYSAVGFSMLYEITLSTHTFDPENESDLDSESLSPQKMQPMMSQGNACYALASCCSILGRPVPADEHEGKTRWRGTAVSCS